jgi:uncharacterized membrane protein
MLNRQESQQQPDLLIRTAMKVERAGFTPEIRAEIKRLLKQLLVEFADAAVVSRTDE